jgi:aryl-alcohol dehydrogenase-like predicted oxidoreductase
MQAGMQAVKEWDFLYKDTDRTIGQAAILFCLSSPAVKSVLPTSPAKKTCANLAEATDKSPLTTEKQKKIKGLWEGV